MSDRVVTTYKTVASFLDSKDYIQVLRNIVFVVVVAKYGGSFLWALYDRGPTRLLRDWRQALIVNFFASLKTIPVVKRKIDSEINQNLAKVRADLCPKDESEALPIHVELPAEGLSEEEVFSQLAKLQSMGHCDYRDGKVSGTVYHAGKEITHISAEAYKMFIWSNPLHPDVFPGVRKMEAEVIAMVVKMFNGGKNACGTTTSGGTESIIMAVKTYRDWARQTKGITKPELVVPTSVHCAFDKACNYFGIKIIHVPVNEKTRKADLAKMRRAVTSNTIAIVGSAPQFPHGMVDDIQGLAVIARQRKIGLHVDCCLGGFLLPFMEKAGFSLAPFDFRVPGVTSISCDTHKYGYAPKGSSVVMYATKELRAYQYFVAPDWPGGIYASPTIAGSRPGALISACWATMMSIGEKGYVDATREIIQASRRIASEIEGIPGLRLMGQPEVSVVAWTSDHFDIYSFGEQMKKRGWNLNSLQYPPSIHFCVTYANKDSAEAFVADLAAIAKELMKNPGKKAEGAGALYGVAQQIPDRSLVDQMARGYIDILFENLN